jgi:hypothetical protein
MTRWSITTSMNILHSRMRLDANRRMDESIVGSSHFVGDTIMKKTRWDKKAPGNNILNLKNIYIPININ